MALSQQFDKNKLKSLDQKAPVFENLKDLYGDDKELFDQFLEEDLKKLYDFTARQLDYHDDLNNLAKNELDPYDLINDALIKVLSQKSDNPLKFGQKLYAAVLEDIDRQVDRLERAERRETSIDNNVVDSEQEKGAKTLGDYVLDFWQPDEDLKKADIIADDEVPTPAELEDMRERQTEIYSALDDLPRRWREDFIFLAIERWSLKKIADLRGVSTEKIAEQIRSSQAFLRERLRDKMLLTNRPHQTS